jgi:hypothetical protein
MRVEDKSCAKDKKVFFGKGEVFWEGVLILYVRRSVDKRL